jgi:hypothetical protein
MVNHALFEWLKDARAMGNPLPSKPINSHNWRLMHPHGDVYKSNGLIVSLSSNGKSRYGKSHIVRARITPPGGAAKY